MKITCQFQPKGLLKNPHLQTILSQYLWHKPKMEIHYEVFELSDGDFLELYFSGKPEKGLAIILHGIIGSIDSHYTMFSFEAFEELGFGGVFINARGAGKTINRTPRFYNGADTRDFNEVVEHLRKRFPGIPMFAFGYSLGAAVLTKWLAEYNQNNPLTAAMAVSVPFDLSKCTSNFETYPGKFYSDYLLRILRKKMLKKFAQHENLIDLKTLKKVRNFPELDELVTAPVNGYLNAEDYYQKASPKNHLKYVKTPLTIVHAIDDPFMSPEAIPSESDLSEHVILELSEHGGHLGFISEIKGRKADYWLRHRIKEFLATAI